MDPNRSSGPGVPPPRPFNPPDDTLEAHEEVVLTQLFRKAIDVIEADPSNRGPTRLIINLPGASVTEPSIPQEDFTRFQDWVHRFNAASQRTMAETQAELRIL